MRTASTRFGIRVQSGTALGTLVAGMSSGTWAQLATNGLTSAIIADDQSNSGSILTFSNGGRCWHTTTRTLHFIGGDHDGGNDYYIKYDDDTNTWSRPTQPPWVSQGVNSQNHSYAYNSIDNVNDRFWYRAGFDNPGDDQQWGGAYLDVNAGTWVTQFDEIPQPVQRAHDTFQFLEHANVYFCYEDGNCFTMDPTTLVWSSLSSPSPVVNSNAAQSAYNPRSQICLFGGDDDSDQQYRVNPNLSIDTLSSTTPYSSINTNGDFSVYLVDNPTNGNFLAIGPDEVLREFDAVNDTWSVISGGSIGGFITNEGHNDLVLFSCVTYGCLILLEWRQNFQDSKMWVYKV